MTKSNIHKALGAAALLGMVLLTGCQDVSTDLKPPKYKTSIPENATRISSFKTEFPQQYASYMKNNETSVMTEYKGSIPNNKNDNVNPLPKGLPRMPMPIFEDREYTEFDEPAYLRKKAN